MNELNNNQRKIVENAMKKKNILKCPNCNEPLTYLMPSGKILHCNKCKRYYKNDNGNVGEETISPYTRKDFLY